MMLFHFSFPLTEVDSSVFVLFWFLKFKVCVLKESKKEFIFCVLKEKEKNLQIFCIKLTNILASLTVC